SGSFNREENGVADIGAFERVQGVPMAVPGTFTPITPVSLPDDPHTIVVTYANEVPFDSSSFGNDDVLVTGPNSYSEFATFVSSAPTPTNPDATDVTYTIPAPVGGWVAGLPNIYSINVQDDSVVSTNSNAVPAVTVGTFAVQLPATFAVANTNDSG